MNTDRPMQGPLLGHWVQTVTGQLDGNHQKSGRPMQGPMLGYLIHPDFAQKMLSFADFQRVAISGSILVSLPAACFVPKDRRLQINSINPIQQ